MANLNTEFDIVIIGCGPTGATLANLLGMQGIRVLVLERELEIYSLPRAVHFDDEAMRVFQTVGIASLLEKKVRVNPGMRFVGADDELILDWPRPNDVGKHGWHPSYRLHQPDLEKLLRDALEKNPSCSLEVGERLLDLQQHTSSVLVTYENVLSGDTNTVSAKYVVGCDGATSTVRSYIKSEMEDLGFKERWLVVDVLLKREMPELGDFTIQYCDPVQPMTYCRNPGPRRRWEMSLTNSIADNEALSEERIMALLSRWIKTEDAEIERKAIYTFRSELAKTWRDKRLLIAGDAAHLTPPFMGQGMCMGIRDAANLAWKLALCTKELTDQTLLDSYQEERSPHAREYIKRAVELGMLMNTIEQQSADASSSEASSKPTMASLAPSLGDSKSFGCSATTSIHSVHKGQLFGQPQLADGQLLDDYCGYHPVLLTRHDYSDRFSNDMAKGISTLQLNGDEHPNIAEALDSLMLKAVFIRPDRYILAAAATNDEVGNLIDACLWFPVDGV